MRTADEFDTALAIVRQQVVPRVIEIVDLVEPVLVRAREVELGLASMGSPLLVAARADLQAQLTALVHPGFVAEAGYARLRHLERYLRAMLVRIDRAPGEVGRDSERMETVARVQAEYADLLASLPASRRGSPEVVELRWMLEELRVSLFAQTLGTAHPVSEKRIYRAIDAVDS